MLNNLIPILLAVRGVGGFCKKNAIIDETIGI
jgi:hypothetical protein